VTVLCASSKLGTVLWLGKNWRTVLYGDPPGPSLGMLVLVLVLVLVRVLQYYWTTGLSYKTYYRRHTESQHFGTVLPVGTLGIQYQ
jgi:hypothetical protein